MFSGLAQMVAAVGSTVLGSGGTMTARRLHDLADANGKVTSSLELAANASLGASSVQLRLPSAAPGLVGTLPLGGKVTIAGTTYSATADAKASGGTVTVSITPVLAAAAVAGVAAVLGAGVWSLGTCLRQDPSRATTPDGGATSAILVPIANVASGYSPRLGDVVTDHKGTARPVLRLGDEVAGSWELFVGAG